MCTALKLQQYMGRNFDYEISYNETFITIQKNEYGNQYAIMGICTIYSDDLGIFPLLYDAMNEHGLCMAGLAFEGNAYYEKPHPSKENKNKIKQPVYRFIFDTLSNCTSIDEVKQYIENRILVDTPISKDYPNTDMHWFVCDKNDSIIIEQTKDGLQWYTASTNVLTNNPPYPQQIKTYTANKELIGKFKASYHTRGNETQGLDGSYTSSGRFQRASYLMQQLEQTNNTQNMRNETFHILSSVEQIYGATPINDKFEYTIYQVVYDMNNLIAYVRTYYNQDIKKYSQKQEKTQWWKLK